MADRWIITKHKFREQPSLEVAQIELARLRELHPKCKFKIMRVKTALGKSMHGPVIEAARDLVALWDNPKIQALDRSERNSAIEETRAKLIEAVHAYDGMMVAAGASEAA